MIEIQIFPIGKIIKKNVVRFQQKKVLSTIIFENKFGFPCSRCQFITFFLCKCVLLYIYTVFSCISFISTHFYKNCKNKCASHYPNMGKPEPNGQMAHFEPSALQKVVRCFLYLSICIVRRSED